MRIGIPRRPSPVRTGIPGTVQFVALAGALGLGGCGDSTPTGPGPGPVPTALEIRGLPEEPLEVGTVVELTGWATFRDGVTQQVDPVWQSSHPGVARVDQRGFLFAQAEGETRITAILGPVSTEAGATVAPANPDVYDLTGQVVNQNGRPVAGVRIVALEGLAAGRTTVTSPDGGYSLRNLEGATTIAAQKDGYEEVIQVATGPGRLDFILVGSAPRVSFGPGQWIVGDEILPGRYFTDPDEGCFWERRSGFSSRVLAGRATLLPFETPPDLHFIAGRELRFDSGQEIVDIHPSDAAFRTNSECGDWRTEPPHAGVQEQIHPGTWLVGTQIFPGTYRAKARELCYWARVAGFGAGQEDVVEDGLVELDVSEIELTVTIAASDAGFYSDDECGPWTRVEDPP